MEWSDSQEFALVPFEASHAETVQGWVRNREEACAWASLDDVPSDPSIFARWHTDLDVHASVLLRDGVPIGYGETWENFDTDAVELGRLIVAPSHRGRGVGHVLINSLCAVPPAAAAKWAIVRIRPGNTKALRCYERAGFRRVPLDQEREYNAEQSVNYIWMSRTIEQPD